MCTVSVLSCVCQLFVKEFHDDDDDDDCMRSPGRVMCCTRQSLSLCLHVRLSISPSVSLYIYLFIEYTQKHTNNERIKQ